MLDTISLTSPSFRIKKRCQQLQLPWTLTCKTEMAEVSSYKSRGRGRYRGSGNPPRPRRKLMKNLVVWRVVVSSKVEKNPWESLTNYSAHTHGFYACNSTRKCHKSAVSRASPPTACLVFLRNVKLYHLGRAPCPLIIWEHYLPVYIILWFHIKISSECVAFHAKLMCSIQSQPDPAVPASARSLSASERSRPQVWQCPRDDDHTTNVGVEILTIWGWIGDGLLLCRSVYIKSRDECYFCDQYNSSRRFGNGTWMSNNVLSQGRIRYFVLGGCGILVLRLCRMLQDISRIWNMTPISHA